MKTLNRGKGRNLVVEAAAVRPFLTLKTSPWDITTTAWSGHSSLPKGCLELLHSIRLGGTSGCNTWGPTPQTCILPHGMLDVQPVHLQVVGSSTGRGKAQTHIFTRNCVYTLYSEGRRLLVTYKAFEKGDMHVNVVGGWGCVC